MSFFFKGTLTRIGSIVYVLRAAFSQQRSFSPVTSCRSFHSAFALKALFWRPGTFKAGLENWPKMLQIWRAAMKRIIKIKER